MKYQALLFDLDGTLVDSVEELYLATNLMLSDCARPILPRTMVAQFVGNGARMLVKRALSGDMQVNELLSDSEVDKAMALFYQHYEQVTGKYSGLYPHVQTVLSAFSHVPKAIVTNKPRKFTELLISGLGIGSFFEVIVCGDDGEVKPSPQPLLSAAEQLKIAPEKCLMIGDSKSDLLAAKAANMDSLAVTYGYHQGEDLKQYNPQYLCDQFLDIITAIN